MGRSHCHRASARLFRCAVDDPARPPVRRTPRSPVRAHRHVRRPRTGRLSDLGEPPLRRKEEAQMTTETTAAAFDELRALSADEVVTHSYVRDIPLSGGRTLALITLDNGRDHTRPTTLGPLTLLELAEVLDTQKERAGKGEIAAVAVTGKPYFLAAGADLSKVGDIPSKDIARKMAQLGHYSLGKLGTLGVPSFVFINGLALGGGLEIALNADYRTLDKNAAAIALPEVFLGIIPGWGGAWLLPNLIGIENALKVVIENPLKQNRMLKAPEAHELGISDVLIDSVNFLEDSIDWADQVINGQIKVKRKNQPGKT